MKVLIAGLGFWSAVSLAQSPDPAKQIAEQKQLTVSGVQTAPIGIQDAMTGPTAKVTGLPYSAEAVTERVQTLPDGNRIVQTSSGMVARDSQGRVRRDESLAVALPGGAGDAPKLETIDDPVAGIHWTLDPQLKVASKGTSMSAGKNALFSNMLPPPVPGPEHTWFYSSGAPGSQVVIQRLAKQTAEANTDVSRVDLGTQSMEGI